MALPGAVDNALAPTITDEARRKEPVWLRNLLVKEFLNMGILSKDVRSNMEETEPGLKHSAEF